MRQRRKPGRNVYTSERAMCDILAAWARSHGARVHAECSGFDLVIELDDGRLVGVEAKLRVNVDVLAQVAKHRKYERTSGRPDVIAVAVPEATPALRVVCEVLDVGVLEVWKLDPEFHRSCDFGSFVSRPRTLADFLRVAPHAVPSRRIWVPPVEVHLPAGVPGPKTVSPWKLAAARLCAKLRDGVSLTRADFAAESVNPQRWVAANWVLPVDGSKPRRYVRGHYLPDVEFPEVAEALGLPRPVAQC